MATVYRGFDTLLARDVAIKVLHAERASEAYRQRMLQEGRAAVRTSHPHLLQIFDVGRVGDTTYLVMELLTGSSLTRHLRDRPPARWSDVLTLLLPAIDAFAALHAAGLVHRDIKPANLFVRERGEALAIVVIDFGITKLSPEMSARIGLVDTQAGTLLGTPAYMAPEQGNGDTADARSDVYSFGVTLYEALAGRLPFPPEPGDTWVSLLTKHMYAAVPPLPRDIPSSVASIVERTLAKLPEDRFQSMQDLAAALRSCLDAPRSAAPPRRATWPLAAAGLGVIATLAVTTARAPAQPLDTPCDEPDAADPRFLWPPAPTILLAHTEPPRDAAAHAPGAQALAEPARTCRGRLHAHVRRPRRAHGEHLPDVRPPRPAARRGPARRPAGRRLRRVPPRNKPLPRERPDPPHLPLDDDPVSRVTR